jgi:hypothetical protein
VTSQSAYDRASCCTTSTSPCSCVIAAGAVRTLGIVDDDDTDSSARAGAEKSSDKRTGPPFARLLQICATAKVDRDQRRAHDGGDHIQKP